MYEVDENDRVVALEGIPPSSAGAPEPVIIADERRVILAYRVTGITFNTLPAPSLCQQTRSECNGFNSYLLSSSTRQDFPLAVRPV